MVLSISRPWRHPTTGTYWYRRRVPKDLQPLLGRTEEKATLRTKEPAIARVRYLGKAMEVEDRWARLRAGEIALASLHPAADGFEPPATQAGLPSLHSFERLLTPSTSIPVPSIAVRSDEEIPPPPIPGLPVPWRPVFDAYAAEARLAPSTVKRWWGVMEALEKELGTDDLLAVTQEFLIDWKTRLLASGRSAGTVRDGYLGSIKAVMSWAVTNKKLASNPVVGITVRMPKTVRLRERDLTDDEARLILTAASGAPDPRLFKGHAAARRWVPWLCAYSGARVNEMTQLRGCDVRCEKGVHLIRISPEAGSVKTHQARDVPIHPHLVEQGFLTFVRSRGREPLFYEAASARKRKAVNPPYKKLGERLAAWVRAIGVDDVGVDPNHGWRHRFKTVGRRAGIPSDVLDAIQGHAPRTEGEKYGSFPPEQLHDAICRIPRYAVRAEGRPRPVRGARNPSS